MNQTLDTLGAQVRDVLARGDTPAHREEVARLLAAALADPGFLADRLAESYGERQVIYRDPALGFCIVGHEYPGAKIGAPHDHGPSWAIYGQAAGETLMREYEVLAPGRVRETHHYLMRPGDVHLYNEGVVHAPSRSGPTRLVRIEGMDLAGIPRGRFEAEG
jgi:hypothetical protein